MHQIQLSLAVVATLAVPGAVTGQTGQKKTDQAIAESSWKWLEGSWTRVNEKPGRQTTETWKRSGKSKLVGKGVTQSGGRVTFEEKMAIEKIEGAWFFVATVDHNAGPVRFKLTKRERHGFVSENPKHDFPKQIEYRYKPESERLTVTISDGKKRIRFEFKKNKSFPQPCP